jgi:hypothetical protein
MSSRTRALIALVASAAVLLGSVTAWALTRSDGVGTDLEQVAADQSRANADDAASRVSDRQDPPPAAVPSDNTVTGVPTVDATVMPTLEELPPPRQMTIPSVGVTMPVAATGVQDDGQMALPDDPSVIGWYRFGAAPGDPTGSAVLGGHVDSDIYGTGPLARLAGVNVGASIEVVGADGTPLTYQVTSVERIYKAALPVDRLFAPDGPHQLAVVTCGGRYLPEAGGYEDNIVVIATPVQS